jgi:hypothetical protein
MRTFIKTYGRYILESHTPKAIDVILDKIRKYGMKSLTTLEKGALAEYSEKGDIEVSDQKLQDMGDRLDGFLEYDPRDEEFFKDLGMDFSGWSDEEINTEKMNILWNDLTPELVEDFIRYSEIDRKTIEDKDGDLPGELPKHILPKFKEWIDLINLY